MAAWTLIRWCAGFLFGLISVCCLIGQVANIRRILRRNESISTIPFIGGVAGTLCLLIIPIAGIWHWIWLALVLDVGAFAVTIRLLSHRQARPAEPRTDRSDPPEKPG